MPNWCSNNLTITCKKKHIAELDAFKKAATNKSLIKNKDLKKEREAWLKANEEDYKKSNSPRLKEWVEHSTMPLNDFFTKVLRCEKNRKGDMIKGNSDLSMQKLMPCPKELRLVTSPVRAENGETEKAFQERLERHQKEYGATDWYKWSINNWGTKWDIDAHLCVDEDQMLRYEFDSAWSPPVNFIANISVKYPNLKFVLYYDEPGMCFRGTFTVENGGCDDQCEDNYTPTCGECEEEYDDNGECSCTRETDEDEQEQEGEVAAKSKNKK